MNSKYWNIKFAFSLAEILVVFVIMTGIILMTGRVAFSYRQKVYDAKYNKLSASISGNISRDLAANTGAEFADYNKLGGNDLFQSVVTNNLDLKECSNCWGNKDITVNSKTYNANDIKNNWALYELNDKTVMAVSKTNTDILIDTNGGKGPNVFGKDIRIYDYPYKTCNYMGVKPADNGLREFEEDMSNCSWNIICLTGDKNITYNQDNHDNDYMSESQDDDCIYHYQCKQGNDNPSYDSTRTPSQGPTFDNGCLYKYNEEIICPIENENDYYISKYHGLDYDNVHITEPTPPECKYAYDCVGKAKDSITYPKKTKYQSLIDKGIVEESIENATPDNNCINTYKYKCIKTVSTTGYDANAHGYSSGANARVIESIENPTPENGCKKRYTYSCNGNVYCAIVVAPGPSPGGGFVPSQHPEISNGCIGTIRITGDESNKCCAYYHFVNAYGATVYWCLQSGWESFETAFCKNYPFRKCKN